MTAETDDLRSRLACAVEATYWDRPYDERMAAVRGMGDLTTNGMTPQPTVLVGHLAEIARERAKVRGGQYGPAHDRGCGYVHLADHAGARLTHVIRRDRTGTDDETAAALVEDRRAWVEVGQFVLAALELIDHEDGDDD